MSSTTHNNLPPPPPPNDTPLASCCEREKEMQVQRSILETTLRNHDRVSALENRFRINLLPNYDGCRCMYRSDDIELQDYPALIEMRRGLMHVESSEEEDEGGGCVIVGGFADDATGCAVAGKSIAEEDSDEDSEFDDLLDSPELNLSTLEEERRRELEWHALRVTSSRQHGYGIHRHMHPRRILGTGAGISSSNPPTAAVVHLFDPDNISCARLDIALESSKFAGRYNGTKFLRSHGKHVLSMNSDITANILHPERDLPCLLAVRDGVIVAVCSRLSGLVDKEGYVDTWMLEEWLDRANVLIRDAPPMEELCHIPPEDHALYASMLSASPAANNALEFYDCGVSGCQKTFPHKHVGVENEEQDGLVVSPHDIQLP